MPSTSYPYGPGAPAPSSNEPGVVTLDSYLKDPLIIQKSIENVPNQFMLGETLLRPVTSVTGVVGSSQLTELDLYIDANTNLQPQEIDDGDEFPAVSFNEPNLKYEETKLVGAYYTLTDRQIRRDRRDLARTYNRRVANKIRLIHNNKVLSRLYNDPYIVANRSAPAGLLWTNASSDPLSDISLAINQIDNKNDLGYRSDIAIIHPDAYDELQQNAKVRELSGRDNKGINPLFNKDLSGLKGLNWIIHNQADRNTLLVLQSGVVGDLVTEIPPFTMVIPQPERLRQRIQSGRAELPVITEPIAAFKITGILS
ncbi:hypothetical protein D1871_11080 [Nakamurella silvestris]|nr:hypothetical protein D1871_11080 [Nakamurella silvestris]